MTITRNLRNIVLAYCPCFIFAALLLSVASCVKTTRLTYQQGYEYRIGNLAGGYQFDIYDAVGNRIADNVDLAIEVGFADNYFILEASPGSVFYIVPSCLRVVGIGLEFVFIYPDSRYFYSYLWAGGTQIACSYVFVSGIGEGHGPLPQSLPPNVDELGYDTVVLNINDDAVPQEVGLGWDEEMAIQGPVIYVVSIPDIDY